MSRLNGHSTGHTPDFNPELFLRAAVDELKDYVANRFAEAPAGEKRSYLVGGSQLEVPAPVVNNRIDTQAIAEAIRDFRVENVIAVPTPVVNNQIDLTPLTNAVAASGQLQTEVTNRLIAAVDRLTDAQNHNAEMHAQLLHLLANSHEEAAARQTLLVNAIKEHHTEVVNHLPELRPQITVEAPRIKEVTTDVVRDKHNDLDRTVAKYEYQG